MFSSIVSLFSSLMFLLLSFIFVTKPSIQNKFILPIINVSVIKFAIVGLVVVLLLNQVISTRNKKTDLDLKISLLIIVSSTIFVFASYYFGFLESSNYANYVYSHYKLDALLLKKTRNYHLTVVVVTLLTNYIIGEDGWIGSSKGGFKQIVKKIFEKSFDRINFITILMMALLIQVLLRSLTVIESEVEVYINFAKNGFDLRNKVVDLPDIDRRTKFVKRVTLEDSVIVHPTQSVGFPIEGNQVLLRYFTYPRTLVTNEKLDEFIKTKKEDQDVYMLIVPEWDDDGYYPYDEFNAKEVFLLLTSGEEIKLQEVVYNTTLLKKFGKIDVGIIKI